MNSFALVFLALTAAALLALPRRWAPLPLIAGACYMTLAQGFEAGPLTFTVIRILVLVGVARVVLRGERLAGKFNGLDWIVLVWGVWAVLSDRFHVDPETGVIFRFGLVYNAWGIYFLLRVFLTSFEDIVRLSKVIALVLVPVALAMTYEHLALFNVFSLLGGVPEVPWLREGKLRAFGPFTHPILAGTVGAVCLPLMVGIWRQHRRSAILGILACLFIVVWSSSSGPLMSTAAGIAALLLWRYRNNMRSLRWGAVCTYLLLDLVMKAPAYYLIARIDLTGGSTGWHRARLIESSLEHLSEWWVYGTDHTRHWMPTGVTWNANHTDITNHYLYMGVLGGLPLMFLFIAMMVAGFSYVGRWLRAEDVPVDQRFTAWGLGAALFAHAATCISVSYFDQSVVFLYVALAALGSAGSLALPQVADRGVAAPRARRFPVWPYGRGAASTPRNSPPPARRGFDARPKISS